MSDLLRRIERYSDPDMLFELDDFDDVADVMRGAHERIAELEAKLARNFQEDRIKGLEHRQAALYRSCSLVTDMLLVMKTQREIIEEYRQEIENE